MRVIAACVLFAAGTAAADPAPTAPSCAGDYAEDLSALSPRARELESKADTYSYAVRTTATYECVSYGMDGNLKRTRNVSVAYGTAFGYRRDGADTLLLTNDHVAEWPAVTDGCKRIADSLAIVDDDHDDYAADDIPLARVVADPALDVAILRAHASLGVIPWRTGKSAALVARDAVEVRGFPLGEFRATNIGKVISAYDHDDQGIWNHDDFVVDALLTSGGSGSPVLAVSCKTGELELVGIFHAHYNDASALNVVVAIDQIRDLMTTLKRSPPAEPSVEPDAGARTRLTDAVHHAADAPFFAFGGLVAEVRARDDGALVFDVFTSEFPRSTDRLLELEDVPADKSFGKLGMVYAQGRECPAADIDAETQAALSHALALLRQDAVSAFDYRATAANASTSRDAFVRAAKQKRALSRELDRQHDAIQSVVDLAGKLASHQNRAAMPNVAAD
jgi:serine protease Do